MNDLELKNLLKRNPINPKYGVPVPLFLICNVTGKETAYTAPEYIRGKIDGAGGLEAFLKSYRSKGAGKASSPVGLSTPKPSKPAVPDVKIPPSKSVWRGEKVDLGPTKKNEPIKEVRVHREVQLDTHVIHVYHPRNFEGEGLEHTHDFRAPKHRND